MNIITEEMRFRQRLCEYAKKNGVTKAARRYHTNRQFVYRQLKKWNGSVRSLALKSRKPKTHPNKHTKEELLLIKNMLKRHGKYGLAEVYIRCKNKGYKRSFGSMCKNIRKNGYKKLKRYKKSYTRYEKFIAGYVGEKVQIDIKYVPKECTKYMFTDKRYYQITAIDEYSGKRILKIVDEKSTIETAKFLKNLEYEMGFKIKTIQVDNGYEFVNDKEKTGRKTAFEKVAIEKGYKIKRIRPYSPWQNGKVERSHREDGKILYSKTIFKSYKDMVNKVKKHEKKYNSTAKVSLNFRSPNEVVEESISLVC